MRNNQNDSTQGASDMTRATSPEVYLGILKQPENAEMLLNRAVFCLIEHLAKKFPNDTELQGIVSGFAGQERAATIANRREVVWKFINRILTIIRKNPGEWGEEFSQSYYVLAGTKDGARINSAIHTIFRTVIERLSQPT
jgi:hypothetical protein